MRHLRLVLVLALLVPACGASGGDDDDDSPDAGPPSVIGTWRAIPSAFDTPPPPVEQRAYEIFRDDGTYEYRFDDTGVVMGTWIADADGRTLTTHMPGNEPFQERFWVDFSGDTLLDAILLPTGSGDSPADVWTSLTEYDTEALTLTWDLQAGGAAVFTAHRSSIGTRTFTGTWTFDGPDVEMRVLVGGQEIVQTRRLIDHKLVVPYERVP